MKKFLFSLAAILCCTLMATAFVSCSDDDDEPAGPYQYSMGFSKVQGSDVLNEMGTIEDAFTEALGVADCTKTFTYNSDAALTTACKKAESTLAGQTLKGSYTFVATNESTGKRVYSWSN